MGFVSFLGVASLFSGAFMSDLCAADWPRWRGPDGSGISTEKRWNSTSIGDTLWEKNVGLGFSAATVKDGRLYIMGWADKKNHVYCLDTRTGNEIWKYSYSCSKGGGYSGTRASVVLEGANLYTFSQDGHVHCLTTDNGREKWNANVIKLGAKNLGWKYSGSPLVTEKVLVINAGKSGIGLNKKTGKLIWGSSGKGGYASPVMFSSGNREYAALFGEESLNILRLDSGDIISSYPWDTKYKVNAADPIIYGNKVFISSGYGKGCALLKMSGRKLTKVWRNAKLGSHFTSPVLVDGYIYGVDGNAGSGSLVCMNFQTGAMEWSEKSLGFGALTVADNKIIYMGERGTLTICKASPDSFSFLTSKKVISGSGKCWTMPVLSDGKIFCRASKGKLVCLDVRK